MKERRPHDHDSDDVTPQRRGEAGKGPGLGDDHGGPRRGPDATREASAASGQRAGPWLADDSLMAAMGLHPSPGSLHFKAEIEGDAELQTVTLSNDGDAAVTVGGVIQEVTDRPIGDFLVSPVVRGSVVQPGGAAPPLVVTFKPVVHHAPDDQEEVTHRKARLRVVGMDQQELAVVKLRGTARPPSAKTHEKFLEAATVEAVARDGAPSAPRTFAEMQRYLQTAGERIRADDYDTAVAIIDTVIAALDDRATDDQVRAKFKAAGFDQGQSSAALDDVHTSRFYAGDMQARARAGATVAVDTDVTGFSSGEEALRLVLGETKTAPSYDGRGHIDLVEKIIDDLDDPAFWAGFVVGIGEGVLTATGDLVHGGVDMAKSAVRVALGSVVGMAYNAYEQIKGMLSIPGALAGASDAIAKGWNLDNGFDRGEFRGKIVGYIATLIIVAELAEGAVTKLGGALAKFARDRGLVGKGGNATPPVPKPDLETPPAGGDGVPPEVAPDVVPEPPLTTTPDLDVTVGPKAPKEKTRGRREDQLSERGLNRPTPLTASELAQVREFESARNAYLKKWRDYDASAFPPETRRLLRGTADNTIRDHMTPDDLAAVIKESRGDVIADDAGIPYDHMGEFRDARESLLNTMGDIKGRLRVLERTGSATATEVEELNRKLGDLSRLLGDSKRATGGT